MPLIRLDTLCNSLVMPMLANSSYLRYYSCVADTGAASGLEETEGEKETEEVPPRLEEWAGNGPM